MSIPMKSNEPMTGSEHYREAERLLDLAEDQACGGYDHSEAMALAAAQVHATLALAAANLAAANLTVRVR